MKNFRRNFKKFRKNIHKYFFEDVVFDIRIGYVIEIIVTVIITAFITGSITQARTIENIKNAQRDAMFDSIQTQMTECKTRATVPEQCTYEVTYDGDIITNIEVTYHGL